MQWYALVGVLATAVLLIENYDIFFSRGSYRYFPEIVIYRRFLYGIMSYYITDILWGVLDSLNLTKLLFVDTIIYYVAMAVGVLFWTQFVVIYMDEDNIFSRFLLWAGRFCFAAVLTITVINFFTPILFWFDDYGIYHACPLRHVQLAFQIVLLLLTSIYTLRVIPKAKGMKKKRFQTIFLFGLVVAVLLMFQLPYPFLPLYTIGYMLGSSLLHAFVVSNEMDELLQRQTNLAIAANEAKSSFLSNMSHEIRTPINAILGMNEMVLRESEDQNILNYSASIRTAGNTLLSIVNDILDFSKIEAGKMEIIPIDYDLSSVLNDLVNMVQTRADDKGLILKLDFNPDTPKILHGDEIRVKQIITNILTNAVKYTEKGTITFSVDFEKHEDCEDSVILKVSIRDTGIGIRQEDIEKLFMKFDRIDEKRNRHIEGTGLGMNITRSLLEMMESHLEVESLYGVGSVFSFSLKQQVVVWDPLGDYEESYNTSLMQRKKYEAMFTAPKAVVLMVDDNPMNLVVFKNLLKDTKVQIDTVESGDECIKISEKKKYDIIFLDHMMPGKDGIETLKELRGNEQNLNLDTPIICLTANAISGARDQYIEAGFDDYLTKPIDSVKLEEMLQIYISDEKILRTSEIEGEFSTNNEVEGVSFNIADSYTIDRLRSIKWIDTSVGIQNNGSTEAYIELLNIFYNHLDDNAEEIEEYYAKQNWNDYTTKIHALKSSARIIGALGFGEEAQRLENAGKIEDLDYIHANHQAFMSEYTSFKAPLSEILTESDEPDISAEKSEEDFTKEAEKQSKTDARETNEGKAVANADIMSSFYKKIKAAADEMDIDVLENTITEMNQYSIPESEMELCRKLKKAVDVYDYEGISKLLNN